MARIRSIHPGLFSDERYVTLSWPARVFYVGLLTECDDQGVFEWKPVGLKMRLFPNDSVDVSALLEELDDHQFIKRYQVAGRDYGAVRNFRKFQRPKKPAAIYPLPKEFRLYVALDRPGTEPEALISDARENSEPFNDALGGTEALLSAEKGEPPPRSGRTQAGLSARKGEKSPQMEDGGDKMEDGGDKPPSPPSVEIEFETAFWPAYPLKVAKGAALKAFRTARKRASLRDILDGLDRYKPNPSYTKHPATWLNGQCWQDGQPAALPPLAVSPEEHQRRIDFYLRHPELAEAERWDPAWVPRATPEELERALLAIPPQLDRRAAP